MDDLFAFDTDQHDETEMNDVRELIKEYPILVKTRETSKCWQDIFHSMHQICAGTFLGAHDFDPKWLTKVVGKYDLYGIKFTWPELVMRTRQIVEYVSERKPTGFWYPKLDKFSLNDFFCSRMKSGKCWSPFVELSFVDFRTPRMWRKMFGPTISGKVEEILKDAWFSLDFEGLNKYYQGVDKFHDWYCSLPDEFIMKCDANHLAFEKFSVLLENLRQCNKDTGCVYPSFISPQSPKWCVFMTWMKERKNVKW